MIVRSVLRAAVVMSVLLLPSIARAQSHERAAMADGLELYGKGEYLEAFHKLEEIKEGIVLLDPPEQVTIHKYRAYCLIVLQREPEAKKEFRKALDLDPELDLDPAQVPPKLVAVFREVKTKSALPEPKKAALRSLELPGWGQWSEKRKSAAGVSAGLVVAGIGVTALEFGYASQAQKYSTEAGPAQKKKFKDQATRYGLQADAALVLTLGAYLGGAYDAYRGAKRLAAQPSATGAVASVHVAPVVAPGLTALVLSGEF